MQLGLQLFSTPFAALPNNTAAAPSAALNGTTGAGAAAALHSPMLACAMDCVASCLAGKGTAGTAAALATWSGAAGGAEGAAAAEGMAVKQEQAAHQAPGPAS